MRFAVDTGGTFTDLVVEDDDGTLTLAKAPTTPDDPVAGVLDVLALAAQRRGQPLETMLAAGELFIHGTTHAINAILTATTARTALLTTQGHEDILLLREGGRLKLFEHGRQQAPPYIPRRLTFPIAERIWADGRVLTPLDEDQVRAVVARLREEEVEAVAVCLLWSIVNPVHEQRVAALLAEGLPGVPVTVSHVLNPTLREFRRGSSAAIDASLKPRMAAYLGSLERRLRDRGFGGQVLVVTSGGGVMDASVLADAPIHSISSGPAMAPVAGRFYGRRDAGSATAIVADAGGTTFDVSLVRDGRIGRTREKWIGELYTGHMTGFQAIDVTSVAAGGGSIAWVDAGGLLHVGPGSAGAEPGPACFGRGGTRPTVTDANVVLGRLDPAHFLGGAMTLDAAAAHRAIAEHVAGPLGLDVESAAADILDVVAENMTLAIEDITVNQGIDPHSATYVAGGGAAGLNAVTIARRLDCAAVVVPETVATLSAAGALISDLSADFSAVFHTETGSFDFAGVTATLDGLLARARAFVAETEHVGEPRIELSVEARYTSQIWDIEVPMEIDRVRDDTDVQTLREAFEALHRQVYSFADDESEVAFLQWNARAICPVRDTDLIPPPTEATDDGPAHRSAHMPGIGRVDVETWTIASLPPGRDVHGPAILDSDLTTVIVDPGAVARRTLHGSVVIELGDPAPTLTRSTRPEEVAR